MIIWGTGAKKRLIPLHRVATSHGYDLCSILPVLHHLTGSDYTNKVGKGKKAALQANPTEFLKDFAHGNLFTYSGGVFDIVYIFKIHFFASFCRYIY